MIVRATKSFCGVVTMRKGQERDISDAALIKDLKQAGYIIEVKPAKKGAKKNDDS